MKFIQIITVRIVLLFILLFLFTHTEVNAKFSAKIDTTRRLKTTIIAASTFYAGMTAYSYYLWYKDTPNSSFHWVNDNSSWFKLDKFGHATTGYVFSEYSYHVLRWAGLNNKKAALYSGLFGFGNMASIEIFDGFHSKWGASWGDLVANACGPLLFSTQQLVWQEQRLRMKFSYLPSDKYAPLNPSKLGVTQLQRVFEDYNSQTYWLSANIASFISKPIKFPKWLNVAIGYGIRGLGVPRQFDNSGNILPDFIKTREYYLSLDIDLQRIPTNSKFLKTAFKLIGFIKVPFPAIEFNKVDKFKWHWMYF